METILGSWTQIVVGIGLFAAGVGVGAAAIRMGTGSRRVRRLEAELRQTIEREERYRRSVAEHFGRTSEIFRDLTGRYRSLYTHLADGARTLCTDEVPALRFEQALSLPEERSSTGAARADPADRRDAASEDPAERAGAERAGKEPTEERATGEPASPGS